MKESSFVGFPEWELVELAGMADFRGLTYESFTEKYRGKKPVLLICPFKELPWVAVIRCAPVNHAYCAFDWLASTDGQECWASRMRADEDVYNGFKREIKNARLTSKDFSALFFLPYANCSGFGPNGRLPNFFRKTTSWFGHYRVIGYVMEREMLDSYVAYMQTGMQQFGRFSFCTASDESGSTGSYLSQDIYSDDIDETVVFRHMSSRSAIKLAIDRERFCRDQIVFIQTIIDRVEAGEKWSPDVHYAQLIRPTFTVPLYRDVAGGLLWEGYDFDLLYQQLSLVYLLNWPQLFSYFEFITTTRDSAYLEGLSLEMEKISYDGREIIGLFKKILDKGRETYPVLQADPFSKYV